ncbi:MAG: class II aldolase/adducin family protein [Epsilonproteobacteria bacterium]|nr:class II aldolase/adducin family protein [Campylobacterota bacterium]
MQSLWNENEAKKYQNDPLGMRVYTSRLLGSSQDLVLHGGGNTSVKIDNLLYVKGSGWNLDTIEKEGFPAVDIKVLKEMATRASLSDTQMVAEQREAMVDKSAPNPSIEAILHAIIPFTYVDHTHADAVVTITNTPEGKKQIQELYGENMLIIDYVMPGFILAKKIYEETKDIDWSTLEGIILLNHGVFTFDDDAKVAYEKMIDIVTKAEVFLGDLEIPKTECALTKEDLEMLEIRISHLRRTEITATIIETPETCYFSTLKNLDTILHKGPLTPEHVIRTKPFALMGDKDLNKDLEDFVQGYKQYFFEHAKDETMLDLAPRWAVIKNRGVVVFGKDTKETTILTAIISHTINAILKAQKLGGWRSLQRTDIFDMEYWELEQAKLKTVNT